MNEKLQQTLQEVCTGKGCPEQTNTALGPSSMSPVYKNLTKKPHNRAEKSLMIVKKKIIEQKFTSQAPYYLLLARSLPHSFAQGN